jgi:hypothetical protein
MIRTQTGPGRARTLISKAWTWEQDVQNGGVTKARKQDGFANLPDKEIASL